MPTGSMPTGSMPTGSMPTGTQFFCPASSLPTCNSSTKGCACAGPARFLPCLRMGSLSRRFAAAPSTTRLRLRKPRSTPRRAPRCPTARAPFPSPAPLPKGRACTWAHNRAHKRVQASMTKSTSLLFSTCCGRLSSTSARTSSATERRGWARPTFTLWKPLPTPRGCACPSRRTTTRKSCTDVTCLACWTTC